MFKKKSQKMDLFTTSSKDGGIGNNLICYKNKFSFK